MSMTITGIPQTISILNELPRRQQKKVIPKAVRAGGGPFLKAVRANAPAMNKIFKRSLILVVRRYPTGALAVIGQENLSVRAGSKFVTKRKIRSKGGISGRGDAVPLHLVENPIKSHAIQGNPYIAFNGIVRRSIRHPGTQGQFVIRKSALQAERAAVQAFTEKLRAETIAEAGRLG